MINFTILGMIIGFGITVAVFAVWSYFDTRRIQYQLPEFQFPEDKPDFDLLYDKILKAINTKSGEVELFDLREYCLYLGNKEHGIYKDWFDNVVCFYGRKDYEQNMIAGIEIKRVNKESEFYIGEKE